MNEMDASVVKKYIEWISGHAKYFMTANPVGKYLFPGVDREKDSVKRARHGPHQRHL